MTAVVVAAGSLGDLIPVHVTMGRLAATVRASVTLLAVCSAVLGAVPPVSMWWLATALAVLICWTGIYAWATWTRGVRPWSTAIDLTVAAGLCLAIGKLVPEEALPRGTSWVAVVISMAIIWAQPAGSAWIWVPAGLIVAGCFVVGSQLAHTQDGGLQHGVTLGTQVIGGAVVMGVAIRTGRAAAGTFDALQAAQTEAEVVAARRTDELAQLRLLHNGPLTTLTMAIHTDGRRPTALLQRRAAANLEQLPRLAQEQHASDAMVRLDERLAQVVVWYESVLHLSTSFMPSLVTADAADAFVDAVSEGLENVLRYAATDRAAVELRDDGDLVKVTVTDRGRGFDPTIVPDHHFGLRQSVIGRMAVVGGSATIQSTPGQGSAIQLEWHRG